MIRIRVYAPQFISSEYIDEQGYMTLPDDGTLNDVFEKLDIPAPFQKIMVASVNRKRTDSKTELKDGDVVSFFSGLFGG